MNTESPTAHPPQGPALHGCCHHSCDSDHGHSHAHTPPAQGAGPLAAGWAGLLRDPGYARMALALALALGAELWHAFAPAGASGWGQTPGMLLAAVAVAITGLGTYARGLAAMRRGRLSVNALMTVAVTGAFAIGQWPEAAMVMTLYALAERLEELAVERARRAIARLMDMAPAQALAQGEDGQWRETAAAQVPVGALMRVRPGERLALDGVVIEGHSAINQAPVTGESLPVDKQPGDAVYAGTLNEGGGLLTVRVSATAQDTQLARIIHAVEQAQSQRAPSQAFIDRFAAAYTPAVFALAVAVALLGPLLAGWPWPQALYRALALLVIACPCALVIATPVTLVSALARAARLGLLIKGGVHLEAARRLRTIAFDKTGTLTRGQPALAAHEVWAGDAAHTLAAARALAAHSQHPVAQAIASGLQGDAAHSSDLPVQHLREQPGQGISGQVQGQRLRLCSPRGLRLPAAQQAAVQTQQEQGRSVSLLLAEPAADPAAKPAESTEPAEPPALALFAVADTLRPDAARAVARLHAQGLQTLALSGDHSRAVAAAAQAAGISQAHGDLLPEGKLALLRQWQAQGPIAMVGDGINDAPALAAADLGIAAAGPGADVAMEAADIALMNGQLTRLPTLIALSHHTHRALWANVALALGLKLAFVALALTGQASMWMAVFADVGVSLLVVTLGLRMLRWKEPNGEPEPAAA